MSVRFTWRNAAAALGNRFPRERLYRAVLRWTESEPAENWAVALSGGADSVTLLLLLWAHWPEQRKRITALHFNHRLRGAAADADERFCRELCRALGVKIRCGRWREARADASEANAREARHAFFRKEMDAMGAKALWLGHQRDDIAETMLMRLARGSGAAGLAAPRPVQVFVDGCVYLRPLLAIDKAEIATALRELRIPWREDASNDTARYLRNRVRRSVLPAWKESMPEREPLAGAALSRELLEDDDVALNAWLGELAPIDARGALSLRRLANKPRAIVRRALHLWLARNLPGAALSRQAFENLLESVMAGRRTRQSLGVGVFAQIIGTRMRLVATTGEKRR